MCKLCDRKEITPIVLPSIDKVPKIGLYPLIHAFRLSICARMECSTYILLNLGCLTNRLTKVACKSRVSIGYDAFRDSKEGEQMPKVQGCDTLSINGFSAWNELGRFGTSLIDNGENGIIVV